MKRFTGEKGHPNLPTESIKAAVPSYTLLSPGFGPQVTVADGVRCAGPAARVEVLM